jgi:hypothetical protein
MLPPFIAFVNSAVTLDHQLRITTIKVSNVFPNLMLSAKLERVLDDA